MKALLYTFLLTVLISCESKKEKNTIFLDYYLEMPRKEILELQSTLISKGKITVSKFDFVNDFKDKDGFDYIFKCLDDHEVKVCYSPRYYNGYLESLYITFGRFETVLTNENPLQYTTRFQFHNNTRDIECVLELYLKKYGVPIDETKKYTVENTSPDYRRYTWERDSYSVVFTILGSNGSESSIEYRLNNDRAEELDKNYKVEESKKRIDDL